MTQSIRVTCVQNYHDGDSYTGTGAYESVNMSLEPWRQAIHAAAVASGFGTDALRQFVLDWAADLEDAE